MRDMVHHFHGGPIWGAQGRVLDVAVRDGGAFISYLRPDQIKATLAACNSLAIDNGAFSAWKRDIKIDWNKFYTWLMRYYHHDKMKFFIIPDVVEGGEEDNDALIKQVPAMFREKATPVWHLHESIERLIRLASEWPRIAFGSSGQYAAVGTAVWKHRMEEAFNAIYITRNCPALVHGLRMLDGRVLGNYPLATADSTNLATNVPKTEVQHPELTRRFRGMGCSEDEVKINRCAVLRNAIEAVTPPSIEEYRLKCAASPAPSNIKNYHRERKPMTNLPPNLAAIGINRVVAWDAETFYSTAEGYSLGSKTMTTEKYIRDPRYETICITATVDGLTVYKAWGHEASRQLLLDLGVENPGTMTVAHNARFDGCVGEMRMGIKFNLLCCTIHMMRITGLSRIIGESLSALADFLRSKGYDIPPKGREVENANGLRLADMDEGFRTRYMNYCVNDTVILYRAAMVMLPECPADTLLASDMTLKMYTRPALLLDQPMLVEYLAALRKRREEMLTAMAAEYNCDGIDSFMKLLRSKPRLAEVLKSLGVDPPMKESVKKTERLRKDAQDPEWVAKRKTDKFLAQLAEQGLTWDEWIAAPVMDYAFAAKDLEFAALMDHPNEKVAALVTARLENNSSQAESRTARFIDCSERGLFVFALQYANARTHRYGADDGLNCFTPGHELLTPQGWVAVEDYEEGTPLMQWWEDGHMSWDEEPAWLDKAYEGPVIDMDSPMVAMTVTPEHRLVSIGANGRAKYRTAQWVAEHSGLDAIPLCGMVDTPDATLSDDELRFLVALQADGSNAKTGYAFGFRRERKITRMKELLARLGWDHVLTVSSEPETHYFYLHWRNMPIAVDMIGKGFGPWLLRLSARQLNVVVDEVRHWDGWSNSNNEQLEYSSAIERDTLWLNTAMRLCGRRAQQYEYNNPPGVSYRLYERKSPGGSIDTVRHVKTLDYKGRVYCPRVDSGNVLVRYKGNIFVSPQCQNLPKHKGDKTLRKSMKAPEGYEVGGADSSQIEARCLAYAANETQLLNIFATGGDPYSYMAAAIYNEKYEDILYWAKMDYEDVARLSDEDKVKQKKYFEMRYIGKKVVLGSGFSMSGNKFAITLREEGTYLRPTREETLAWLRTLPPHLLENKQVLKMEYDEFLKLHHNKEAKRANWTYRAQHSHITAFWDTCDWVLSKMCVGDSGYFGGPDGELFYFDGKRTLFGEPTPGIRLPNGEWLVYPYLKTFRDPETGFTKYTFKERKGKSWLEKYIYGGSLTENLIQALAFTILTWQAVRINKVIPVKGNVHDEWFSVYPAHLREQAKAIYEMGMKTVPPFVPGLPLNCEFSAGPSYGDM